MRARIAVVGGGVSGLAAAHRLRDAARDRRRVIVLEQRDRLGGVCARRPRRRAATTSAPRRSSRAAPRRARCSTSWAWPTSSCTRRGAAPAVRAGGGTVPLPAGTLLGVPTSGRAGSTACCRRPGAPRRAAERDRPLRWTPGGDVALGGLLRERFGDELADRLADPLLGGVYAGRVDALGLRATLPASPRRWTRARRR